MPASKEPNITCDWVWSNFTPKNYSRLGRTLAAYGGQQYTLVRLRFAKGTKDYNTFKVHDDTRIVVKDSAGQEQELKLFGSILESDGQFKIMSYIVH